MAINNYQNGNYTVLPNGQAVAPNGAMYNGVQQNANAPVYKSTLTVDEKKKLQANADTFNMKPTSMDVLIGQCDHINPEPNADGVHELTLNQNGDGTVTCRMCGETFHLRDDLTDAEIDDPVSKVIDILQSTKALGGCSQMDRETVRDFYTTIPLLKKLKGVYHIAAANYRYMQNADRQNTQGNPMYAGNAAMNMFNMMNQGNFQNPYATGQMNMQNNMVQGGVQQVPYQQQVQYQQVPVQQQAPVAGQVQYINGQAYVPAGAPGAQNVAPMVNQQVQQTAAPQAEYTAPQPLVSPEPAAAPAQEAPAAPKTTKKTTKK